MKKTAIVIGALVLLIAAFFFIAQTNSQKIDASAVKNIEGGITVFKSSSCGCCEIYANYLKKNGLDVNVVNTEDLKPLMENKGVPSALHSCHTSILGDYFVEGHVPLEAIVKLAAEKPDIKGIAMPGMPSGSPGMPGAKKGPFIIYAVNNDGTYREFMRI